MRLASRLQRSLAGCAVAALLGFSASAAATPLHNTGWLAGSPGPSYHIDAAPVTPIFPSVSTGGFTGTFGLAPIVYWCFDLTHSFSLMSTNDYVASLLGSGTTATRLSELFNVASANGGFTSLTNSAAFQLAIWNIEYDSDALVESGTFAVSGGSAAINLADSWLGLLSNPTYANPTNAVIRLDSTDNPQHQNFITFSTIPNCCGRTVPEPPMLPLVLTVAGLAVLVQTRRRTRVGGE